MKRFSLLFFLFLISTFHAFAQTHFITAGQTQGMIYTDYVPDYCSPSLDTSEHPGYRKLRGEADIDLNHDGVVDCRVTYSGNSGPHGAFSSDSIYLFDNCYVYSEMDSFEGNWCFDSSTNWKVKRFYGSDTLISVSDSAWQNGGVIVYSYMWGPGHGCDFGVDTVFGNTPHYYFVKLISNNDTLYGYLHFSTAISGNDGAVFIHDFAIEGPTSSYIISSVDDLFSSNISVSPNPFTNQINISTEEPFQYTITDYSGRLLLSGTSDKTITTETIPTGSYLLTIKNEEVFSVRKMVKAIW